MPLGISFLESLQFDCISDPDAFDNDENVLYFIDDEQDEIHDEVHYVCQEIEDDDDSEFISKQINDLISRSENVKLLFVP
mmetsp:Transcript_27080/g.35126  ORF Transcript_27080/g.35126 Transcript_27080/m.35126 type:complete len:80 (-) Transcript_27080:1058-1297(-)